MTTPVLGDHRPPRIRCGGRYPAYLVAQWFRPDGGLVATRLVAPDPSVVPAADTRIRAHAERWELTCPRCYTRLAGDALVD